jgi:hypothetical protein
MPSSPNPRFELGVLGSTVEIVAVQKLYRIGKRRKGGTMGMTVGFWSGLARACRSKR